MSYLVQNKNREQGFTLVEILIAMLIGGIITAAVTTTFIGHQKYYMAQEQITEMVQGTRAAMDMISREVRNAGYSPTGAAFHGVFYNPGQLQIMADLDGNGDTLGPNENIIYSLNDSDHRIVRTEVNGGGGGQPFAENMQNFWFEYKKQDGSPAITSAEIRQIKITITGKTAKRDLNYPANGGYRIYTLTSLITPPNLAY